jgi:hypothetical protein
MLCVEFHFNKTGPFITRLFISIHLRTHVSMKMTVSWDVTMHSLQPASSSCSKMLANIYQTAWCHIPEYGNLHIQVCESILIILRNM